MVNYAKNVCDLWHTPFYDTPKPVFLFFTFIQKMYHAWSFVSYMLDIIYFIYKWRKINKNILIFQIYSLFDMVIPKITISFLSLNSQKIAVGGHSTTIIK